MDERILVSGKVKWGEKRDILNRFYGLPAGLPLCSGLFTGINVNVTNILFGLFLEFINQFRYFA
jgi:hypothetical protein